MQHFVSYFKSKRSLKRSRDRDAKIAIGSPIFFHMAIGIGIGIGIKISIFDKVWDRDRDLDFGDRVHAKLPSVFVAYKLVFQMRPLATRHVKKCGFEVHLKIFEDLKKARRLHLY